jgi:hypothetical protein
MDDEHSKDIKIEAKRLFHIGLYFGVNSNEMRLQMLERLVIWRKRMREILNCVRERMVCNDCLPIQY